ncbi:hypothetical protein, partial [Ralstonia solanacearum species complex bacterium KE055]|uniref:hypothetical protein n=1 Tax=Ralstonia solanacearum species complex bacterium KE055 TaxID=3119586 RepID=UPI002FC29C86
SSSTHAPESPAISAPNPVSKRESSIAYNPGAVNFGRLLYNEVLYQCSIPQYLKSSPLLFFV